MLKKKLLARESARGEPLQRLPRRQGSVLAAVTRVLELAREPMIVSDIHEAVKRVLDDSVPLSTVKDALSAHTLGGDHDSSAYAMGSTHSQVATEATAQRS